jgi:tyrosine-protein phosphatase YwqE
VKESGIPVTINAAAEYFLDEYMEELLKRKEPLLTLKNNWVLCEFSLAFASRGLRDILFEMQMQGYQPVIAHPERYIYLQNEKSFFDELKNTGCLFQLNITALCGSYGKSVQELAHYLIKNEYYNLLGTDLHNARHLEALADETLETPLKKLIEGGKIRNKELVESG